MALEEKLRSSKQPEEILEQIEQIEEISLLTEDDPADGFKRTFSNLLDTILSKTIARTEEIGEFEDIDEIEDTVRRNKHRMMWGKRAVIAGLGLVIVFCVISISATLGRYAARVSMMLTPVRKARMLIEEEQYDKAHQVLKGIKVADHNNQQRDIVVESYLKVAEYYYTNPNKIEGANIKQAVWIYETLLGQYPSLDSSLRADMYLRLGKCYERLLLYTRAIETYQIAADLVPESVLAEEAQYRIALSHLYHEDFKAAREALKQLIDTYPDSDFVENAFFRIGDAYSQEAQALQARLES